MEFLKWWPYYDGHYLLNKNIDLLELFNDYDSDRVFNMIDNLIIEDSVYDEQNDGHVLKKRTSLNRDYGRIKSRNDSLTATDDIFDTLADAEAGLITGMDAADDGTLPGLAGIPMMS
jgi:hypothetical protein